MNLRARRAAIVIAAFLITPFSVFGQGVPMSECDPCPVPVEDDFCCIAIATKCEVFVSPAVVTEGEVFRDYLLLECVNCCKYAPDECHGNDPIPSPRTCDLVGPSYMERVLFMAGIRSTDQSWVISWLRRELDMFRTDPFVPGAACTLIAPKCEWRSTLSWVEYEEGREVEATLSWRMTGLWMTVPAPPCDLIWMGCPVGGQIWFVWGSYCGGFEVISAKADRFWDHGCGLESSKQCPPRLPCE